MPGVADGFVDVHRSTLLAPSLELAGSQSRRRCLRCAAQASPLEWTEHTRGGLAARFGCAEERGSSLEVAQLGLQLGDATKHGSQVELAPEPGEAPQRVSEVI